MANDLTQLMGLGDVQLEQQKRYSDALREKRNAQAIAAKQAADFEQALSSQNPNIQNPADVFKAYSAFNAAMNPSLTRDADILSQIAEVAAAREKQGTGSVTEMLDKTSKGKVAEYTALLKDLYEARSSLSGKGLVSDVGTATTGPLAQFMGQYGPGADVRTRIDNLSSRVKNKYYGSAISENEMKDANKWLPSSKKQETQNTKRLDTIYQSKMNELKSVLRTQGVPEEQIVSYLGQLGITDVSPTATAGYDEDALLKEFGL